MRRLLLALPIAALLVVAPTALAGGWATVGLSSTPAGTQPGTPWGVDLTILQHGRTPLDGLTPVVTISNGDATRNFTAKPTGKPGVYHAEVVFPTAGSWNYQINDGFISGVPHTYPAVEIGAPASAPAGAASTADDGGFPTLWLVAGLALLVAAVLLIVWDRRRGRGAHRPQVA